ncbi:unnamed protein product [Dovyalis caffra]|uniref:Ribosomal protein L33 n=1 Tax=Dovyalis caffra TaxID=77055 RepID=A0AAV1R732_9ROSI|nr:unnamed protein product [Dovyalis caffra]
MPNHKTNVKPRDLILAILLLGHHYGNVGAFWRLHTTASKLERKSKRAKYLPHFRKAVIHSHIFKSREPKEQRR